MFEKPGVNIYSRDVIRLVRFYESLGFETSFGASDEAGEPLHVEVTLDGFTVGIAAADALMADHGLTLPPEGTRSEIVLWSDDVDRDHSRLRADGAPSLSPPHDLTTDLRVAWVADPDGNPVRLVQRRDRSGV